MSVIYIVETDLESLLKDVSYCVFIPIGTEQLVG